MSAGGIAEKYVEGDSPLHRLDARVKVVGVLAYIVAAAITPTAAWSVFILLALPLAAAAVVSRLPVALLLRRSLLALPFILVAAPTVFTRAGETAAVVPLGPWTLTATREGTLFFLTVLTRSWLSVGMAALLTATTPFHDLSHALQSLRVPRILVAIMSFMYRYLFVLGEEAQRMLRARDARSAVVPGRRSGGSLSWRARVAGGMAGSLFLRTYERSERIYMAMQARGYQGEMRVLEHGTVSSAAVRGLIGFIVYLVVIEVAGVVYFQ